METWTLFSHLQVNPCLPLVPGLLIMITGFHLGFTWYLLLKCLKPRKKNKFLPTRNQKPRVEWRIDGTLFYNRSSVWIQNTDWKKKKNPKIFVFYYDWIWTFNPPNIFIQTLLIFLPCLPINLYQELGEIEYIFHHTGAILSERLYLDQRFTNYGHSGRSCLLTVCVKFCWNAATHVLMCCPWLLSHSSGRAE